MKKEKKRLGKCKYKFEPVAAVVELVERLAAVAVELVVAWFDALAGLPERKAWKVAEFVAAAAEAEMVVVSPGGMVAGIAGKVFVAADQTGQGRLQ